MDENGNPSVDGNASEVTVFKQFDAMTDRFAVETLELSVNGSSEYWSLSTTEAVRDGGRVVDTYITLMYPIRVRVFWLVRDSDADTVCGQWWRMVVLLR